MTSSDHRKVLKQIGNKASKTVKFAKFNTPKKRKQGENSKRCTRCGRRGAHIGKYGINLCRQCFRDIATDIGFKKYS